MAAQASARHWAGLLVIGPSRCRPGLRQLLLLTDAGVIADADACHSLWTAEAVNVRVTRGSQGNGIASGL